MCVLSRSLPSPSPAHHVIEQLGVGATCDACRGVPQYRSHYYPNSQLFTRLQLRNLLTINKKRKPSTDFLFDLKAEEEGFKPPIPERGIPDFESSAFGHSAILP